MERQLPSFLFDKNLSLILFGGKGGVGKTTCAAATSLSLACQRPDEKILVVSIDPAHSLKDSFANSVLPRNLELDELDASASLMEFKSKHEKQLQQIAQRGTFLDNEDISQLLELSMPGLDEVMAFTRIAHLVDTTDYSCIVVDSAPTGHVLRFMELPDIMEKWVKALDAMLAKHRYMVMLFRGSYRKDQTDEFLDELSANIEHLQKKLKNSKECRFVPVTAPDPMSIPETRDLVDALKRMEIPVCEIIINRVYLDDNNCSVCHNAYVEQYDCLKRITDEYIADYSLWSVPLMGAQVQGAKRLSSFWDQVRKPEKISDTIQTSQVSRQRVDNPAPFPGGHQSLLLFGGKGGVGKTTLACATAVRLADESSAGEVMILSTDPAHSLSDCLDTHIRAKPIKVRPGLTAIELNAHAEFTQLKEIYAQDVAEFFRSLTGGGKVDLQFDREVIENILDLSPPGLDEVIALSRIVELMEQNEYDKFVLDTAPTGHLIRLLELPELVEHWLKVIFGLLLKYKNLLSLPKVSDFLVTISKRIKNLRSILTDADRASLYVVSIPTDMALEEIVDLVDACKRTGIHIPALFLNRVIPESNCPTCRAVMEDQFVVRKEFDKKIPDVEKTIVYQSSRLVGEDRLASLGSLLYSSSRI
ncbi:MAG: ArsA family ATPase [Verrucomicrobia bacterium]|nr:ArsA family ATPase [Verrucomicrobiota bacterium]MCF7707514.1 ArsA family ATPase [Verrucomicrobiota bacterium]